MNDPFTWWQWILIVAVGAGLPIGLGIYTYLKNQRGAMEGRALWDAQVNAFPWRDRRFKKREESTPGFWFGTIAGRHVDFFFRDDTQEEDLKNHFFTEMTVEVQSDPNLLKRMAKKHFKKVTIKRESGRTFLVLKNPWSPKNPCAVQDDIQKALEFL